MFAKRFAFLCFDSSNLIPFRVSLIIFTTFPLLFPTVQGASVESGYPEDDNYLQDTVFVKKGRYFLSKNTSITLSRDTFYIAHPQKKVRTDSGSYQNSKVFFDTVYRKFSRNKITQILYYLAFVAPKQSDVPDKVQVMKSAMPFVKFEGKIIRNIDVKILPPFGGSVYDTGIHLTTGIGNTLNSVHLNTRKYVIRRNLLFKKGDTLNPALLADNERLLRNIRAIDNARIIVTQVSAGNDSVDMFVVAKDVWSIGLDVQLIGFQQVRFRPYDANFLGLGDQLTTRISLDLYRLPFFIFEGLAYTYSNIGGSLINGTLSYTADQIGNRALLLRVDRSFLTYMTKWAGGASISWETAVNELSDTRKITSKFNREGIWLGRAFQLPGKKEMARIVLAGAVYRKQYSSRPVTSIDSNMLYNDQLQLLATISLSKNYYYLADYILDFGKTENLPYGHLFQITLGRDQVDFFTRFYSGFRVSAGKFFDRFGYISAYVKFGGFFNRSSFEDAVVKFNLRYFTPLFITSDNRYRLRGLFSADYRFGFNSRPSNLEYFDGNLDFNIDKVNNKEYFHGTKIVAARLGLICFTPWHFYGFRFAIMAEIQSGLVAYQQKPLLNAPLFTSIGLSAIIKNNNLVFPAFVVSGYFYPATGGNFNQFQYVLNSNLRVQYYDFNVTAPYMENLAN